MCAEWISSSLLWQLEINDKLFDICLGAPTVYPNLIFHGINGKNGYNYDNHDLGNFGKVMSSVHA